MSAVLQVHTDHDAWHLGPADNGKEQCVMPDVFHVVPIRDDTVLNGIFQLDYTSPILIIESNRSGRGRTPRRITPMLSQSSKSSSRRHSRREVSA